MWLTTVTLSCLYSLVLGEPLTSFCILLPIGSCIPLHWEMAPRSPFLWNPMSVLVSAMGVIYPLVPDIRPSIVRMSRMIGSIFLCLCRYVATSTTSLYSPLFIVAQSGPRLSALAQLCALAMSYSRMDLKGCILHSLPLYFWSTGIHLSD